MVDPIAFLGRARAAGFGVASGVPCSHLGSLIAAAAATPDLRWVAATNEGDAAAIAAGAALGGVSGLVLLQNSGLGNAVNPLTSLHAVFRLPVLLIVSWRGAPDDPPDEPQHGPMGAVTTRLLELLGIPWAPFPGDDAAVDGALARATVHMARAGTPFALVVRPGDLARAGVAPPPAAAVHGPVAGQAPDAGEPGPAPGMRPTRAAVLAAVCAAARPSDVVLATTGHTGRELLALADRPNHLAMVGSMGCVGSLGLGLALVRPERRVLILDGDGAALMRLGALATIAREAPPGLVHVMLDNEMHASTGGQPTGADRVDLAAVAAACGYPSVRRARTAADVAAAVAGAVAGPTFVHAKIAPESGPPASRPTRAPAGAAARLRAWLAGGEAPA